MERCNSRYKDDEEEEDDDGDDDYTDNDKDKAIEIEIGVIFKVKQNEEEATPAVSYCRKLG